MLVRNLKLMSDDEFIRLVNEQEIKDKQINISDSIEKQIEDFDAFETSDEDYAVSIEMAKSI